VLNPRSKLWILKSVKTKKGEKEKLRKVILDQAVAYLKINGQGGTATDEIMTYMGLTRGALYSHFKSKEELFAFAVCQDLEKLEQSLRYQFTYEGHTALQKIIEAHLSEKNLTDVENSCVFTSLSSDMLRSKATYRAMYERHMNKIYDLFSAAIQKQFPEESKELADFKAINLYSGLVGTLTMARTMKDITKAKLVLECGKTFLIANFAGLNKTEVYNS
jgi:TetR/AcrR family transcriptional repressor of nem operon